jgi:Raf kinase inhibitor-like YbhB/YbcL family protein
MGGKKIIAAASAALVWTGAGASAASWMTLTSTSIKDGQRIPAKFGANDPKRACSPKTPQKICPCPGQNVSPALSWQGVPKNAKSLALLMYDIDGRFGAGVSHWVAYNIAPSATGLAEGDATAGKGFTGGAGTRGNANYMGPCPPQGDGPHHYTITLVALDLAPDLPQGLTREAFMEKAQGHMLASATLGGLFARQY